MAINDYAQWIRSDMSEQFRQPALQSGDAYPSHRVAEIPGPEMRTVPLIWRFITESVFQSFMSDFIAVGFFASFDFTVPGDGAAAKYRFTSMTQTAVSSSQWTMTATLERWNGV